MKLYDFPSFPRSMPKAEFYVLRRSYRMMRDLPVEDWIAMDIMSPFRLALNNLDLVQWKACCPQTIHNIIKWRITGG